MPHGAGIVSLAWQRDQARIQRRGRSRSGRLPGFDPARWLDPTQRLSRLLTTGLADRSGQRWRSSSPGYIVLAAVLEQVARQPYPRLVQDSIIEPLELKATTVGTALHSGALLPVRVQPLLHSLVVAQPPALPDPAPPDAVGPTSGRPASRVNSTEYCAGHFHGTIDGRLAYLHPGDNPDYQSSAPWLPEAATAVVVLSNDEDDDIEQAVAELVCRAST